MVTIFRQVSFITQKDLGYDRDNILVINSVPRQFDAEGLRRMETVKTRLSALPGVVSTSLSWRTAAERGDSRALQVSGSPLDEALSVPTAIVDDDFLQTYDLSLKDGRFFSPEHPADRSGIVLNKTAVDALGWKGDATGKELIVWSTARPSQDVASPPARTVLGVVDDFHFESLHRPIAPLAIVSVEAEQTYRVLSLKLASTDLRETVARVEAAWREVLPGTPFEYNFLDDQIEQSYRTEQQTRGIIGLAAALAVLIAGLGMLGLASISVVQRTKEVGIRKVLGATVGQILYLLSRDFARPVVIAIVAAFPSPIFLFNDGWTTLPIA